MLVTLNLTAFPCFPFFVYSCQSSFWVYSRADSIAWRKVSWKFPSLATLIETKGKLSVGLFSFFCKRFGSLSIEVGKAHHATVGIWLSILTDVGRKVCFVDQAGEGTIPSCSPGSDLACFFPLSLRSRFARMIYGFYLHPAIFLKHSNLSSIKVKLDFEKEAARVPNLPVFSLVHWFHFHKPALALAP